MDRTALITGASRGLGRTVAGFLAAQGYGLILTARGAEELAAAEQELRRHGGPVTALAGDVADPAHRRNLAEAAEGLGRLDILFNNASTLGATPLLPLLGASGGLVVNISSDAARGGYPGWGGYGLTKAALDLASATLAQEIPGIGVVAVDPGDLRTRMHQDAFPGEDISDRPLPEVTLPFWAWLFGQ
ncbi:MAG TPA: SDR family oxidoreductase, partial [Thermoanaerobaculia bacterium]